MFKQNMKKALALLASVLILCTLIPLSALLTASADSENIVANGGFEDEGANWAFNSGSHEFVSDAHGGNKALKLSNPNAWGEAAIQTIAVEANTDYTITLWAKDTTDITLILKTGATDQNYAQKSISAGSTWTQITYTFNSGDNNSLYLGFMGQESGNGAAIIDDIRIVALKDPSFDGYIYNGDFETGVFGKWQKNNSSLSYMSNDAHAGIYAAAVKGVGDWGGHLLYQEITLEAGKTYTLSFWYKPVSNGVNYTLRTPDKATTFDSLYMDSNKVAQWTYHEVTFEAGTATEIEMTFSGSGKNNGTNDEVLIDDVRLVNLSGNEMDRAEITTPAGTSIRDSEAPGEYSPYGLAFRFNLLANGIEIVHGNQYVAGTGTMKLYKYADVIGNLQSFGAVVGNHSTLTEETAKDVLVLENTASNSQVIDIPAKYLMTLTEDATSYAVRILDIPTEYLSREIYARPYYIYEIDGEIITVYGDVVHANYAGVEAIRRTKRVLTIGNYDGFETDLYDVLKDADYDQVILGAYNNGAYNKNDDNGKWVSSTIAQADLMADERWQYIVVNNATDLAWANANKPADATVLYYGDDVAVDTALANLATVLNATEAQQNYTAALTWFLTLTGESLDLIEFNSAFSDTDNYNMCRAAAHAYILPGEITDLSEVVILASSDFQPNTNEKGIQNIRDVMGALNNAGYYGFDGLLFTGDYTQAHGSDLESGNVGINALDGEMHNYVNFDRTYGQGNHDHANLDLMAAYGPNDPLGAPYGIFNITEDSYNAYGAGGQQVAADLQAYFAEKLANGWGNKPIFVLSHLPLHYNYRTMKDKGGASAMYIINALNAANDAGLNIIFLFGHNHSGGYDDYLGGAAIYVPKGDSIIVADPANYANAPIETELKFTYMNFGYVSSYGTNGTGVDTALTMCTFRIQENGDVIITRYDKNGEHNLKSAGKANSIDESGYTFDDERVYESSRIVGANKDEAYTEN